MKLGRSICGVASVLAFACLAPAMAQDVAGMEMMSVQQPTSALGSGLPNDGPTLLKLSIYGRCLAKFYGSSDILSVPPESERDRRSIYGMTYSPEDCANRGLAEYAPMFMRGVYAEFLLTEDFDLNSRQPLGRHGKVFRLPDPARIALLPEKQRAALSFVQHGACVAKMDMPNVAKLFATEVGSGEEKQAFTALTPALSQCLAPGQTLKINRFKLRGYLAEGAYRELSTGAGQ